MKARRSGIVALALTTMVLASCGSSRSAAPVPVPRTGGKPTTTVTRPATTTVPAPGTTPSSVTSPTTVVPALAEWPSYHDDDSRTAAVPAGPSLDPASKAWTADLGGVVHGQAVVADGRIIAATENNRVVALDPRTGHVLWSTSLGPPLRNASATIGCGDIDPLGITSTPVVDLASRTVYVVGEVSGGGDAVHHQLDGLDLATGAVTVSHDVDPPLPPGERPLDLLQRAALAIGNGRVYVAYGGNDGDCGDYHGWVVGVDLSGAPRKVSFEVASDGEGGAIWESGGAPALDSHGDLYVTTGNANPDPPEGGPDPKRYTESVVKLTPTLAPLASFKDEIAGGDEDLATGNPVLLPGGLVFAVGKTDVGYVLDQGHLGEVAAIKGVCGSDPDGGPAYDAATGRIFVPCKGGGIQELDLTTDALGPKLEGANGAPILVGSDLWAVEYPTGTLTEYDAVTGATLQTIPVGQPVANFASPCAALGLILVPTDSGLVAFDGPGGPTAVPSRNG